MYGASCSGTAMQGIAPDSENIGHWWLAEETFEEAEARYAADIMDSEEVVAGWPDKEGIVRGLNS